MTSIKDASAIIARGNDPQGTHYGAPAVASYSFAGGSFAMSAAQQSAVKDAMALWSDVAMISFFVDNEDPEILFKNYTKDDNSTGGTSGPHKERNGEKFLELNPDTTSKLGFNLKNTTGTDLGQGGEDRRILIHEMGHAIGLSHPGKYNAGTNVPVVAAYYEDSLQYTVMSYLGQDTTGANWNGQASRTPGVHDIAAAQRMYGANMVTRRGDTTYGFNSNAGAAYTIKGEQAVFTVWDTGGIDTLNFSGYAVDQKINLAPASFSDVGGLTKNISLASAVDGHGRNVWVSGYDPNDIRNYIENAIGGSAKDSIYGNEADNRLEGRNGDDRLYGYAGDDYLSGGNNNDTLVGAVGDDSLFGGEGDDKLYGDEGHDSLSGGGGDDRLDGGVNSDTVRGGDGNDTLFGDTGSDKLYGDDNNDSLNGGIASDTLEGGNGNDTLDGGTSGDSMVGGTGNDQYYVSGSGDVVVDTKTTADKDDKVFTVTNTYSLAESSYLKGDVEDLEFTGTGNFKGTGNALANDIRGGAGDDKLYGLGGSDYLVGKGGHDTLDGGANYDTLSGGDLSDVYYLFDVNGGFYDGILEAKSGGTSDAVQVRDLGGSVRSYTLADNIEIGSIVGAEADQFSLIGNDGNNKLYDDVGDNYLFGGKGNDTLNGGYFYAGDELLGGKDNDTYVLDLRRGNYNYVTEFANEGIDRVNITAFHEEDEHYTDAYTLTANVEYGYLYGDVNFDLYGNAENNRLYGNAYDNVLTGYDGADYLSGRLGDDILVGGKGDDTYVLNDLTIGDGITLSHYDVVIEEFDEGIDTVLVDSTPDNPDIFSTDWYDLADNVENATITGSRVFDLYGNYLNNVLIGNSAANSIAGGDGSDTMIGGAGADTLDGGEETDYASYETSTALVFVDLNTPSRNTGDAAGDQYVLIEGLIGSKYADVLIGNLDTNTLIGGAGKDQLFVNNHNYADGNVSSDRLEGGDGDDQYTVQSEFDVIVEKAGEGTDMVFSYSSYVLSDNVENLVLYGATNINGSGNDIGNAISGSNGGNYLKGYGGNDSIYGYGGGDTFDGGVGADTLVGGEGLDVFIYWTQGDSGITSATADTIDDWNTEDVLDFTLSGNSSNYGEFATSATSIGAAAAFAETKDTPDLRYAFLYNGAAGKGFLLADMDGDDVFDTGIVLKGAGSDSSFSFSDIA